jgi:hypothetical protein
MDDDLQQQCVEAQQSVLTTRASWLELYHALDSRDRAHRELQRAQHACRQAAKRIGIKTLPLDGAALSKMRAIAEAQAHERLRAAKQALAAAH